MGAVLYQEEQIGKRHIASYASAKFSPVEARYHCNEQECLAVIWEIKRYRPYLDDSHFTLRTDSKALTWLRKMKDEKFKLARWACLLDEFSFTIEHCAGKDNELPDALSRHPVPNGPTPGEPDLERMLMPTGEKTETTLETTPLVSNALVQISLSEEITVAYQLDPIITHELEMWQEVCNKEERTEKEEEFEQKHKLDIYGFWKKHPTLGTWSLRVPASSVQCTLDVP